MNKQELIEGIEAVPAHNTRNRPWIDKKLVLGIVRQLDEPQKVTLPQFVADWLKLSKSIGRSLFGAMRVFEKDDDVEKWLQWSENQELFARAWLDGYEVEKEKRYRVRVKGLGHEFRVLKYNIFYNDWFTGSERGDSSFRLHHSRKELEEAGFGWVFGCPGIEIEEIIE